MLRGLWTSEYSAEAKTQPAEPLTAPKKNAKNTHRKKIKHEGDGRGLTAPLIATIVAAGPDQELREGLRNSSPADQP